MLANASVGLYTFAVYGTFEGKTKMIDSILRRHTDPVTFHNISTNNTLITEPQEIKEAIRTYFENWTKSNPTNKEI